MLASYLVELEEEEDMKIKQEKIGKQKKKRKTFETQYRKEKTPINTLVSLKKRKNTKEHNNNNNNKKEKHMRPKKD